MAELKHRVENQSQLCWEKRLNTDRKKLIDSGERGDKIRIYREQDNVVLDHRTGQKLQYTEMLKEIYHRNPPSSKKNSSY